MIGLLTTIFFTISISAVCSLLEAFILSTTVAEIEGFKKESKKKGRMLEQFRTNIDETSSAILSLNTIANTLGAVVVGGLATHVFGSESLIYFSLGMTGLILIFGEIIPKTAGVTYRKGLQKHAIYLLWFVRAMMLPLVWFCTRTVRFFIRKRVSNGTSDEEIILLAEKGAKEGNLTKSERSIITNTLRLDEVHINEIMTPRTVVSGINDSLTIGRILEEMPNIPFARLPIFNDTIDEITGIVRRRDLLEAKANDKENLQVKAIKEEAIFIPENAVAADALKLFLKTHLQMAIVVDEFGSMSGVITMEDVFEYILGQEIFEKDDIAVDMRELARRKKNQSTTNSPFPNQPNK